MIPRSRSAILTAKILHSHPQPQAISDQFYKNLMYLCGAFATNQPAKPGDQISGFTSRERMEILHIPEKPPISPHNQPTVEVFVASIQAKLAHTIIRHLNKFAPLESLCHVKRVRKDHGAQPIEGNIKLSVILCLAPSSLDKDDSSSCDFPHDVKEFVATHNLNVSRAKVCKYAATSKEEWEEQCKLWPTSFHPPTYNIEGITGFSDEDSKSIFSFMNEAIQLAKSGDSGSVVNAAVIIDPSVKQVISRACDQTFCHKNQEILNSETEVKRGSADSQTLEPNGFPNETEALYSGVSCLFPRGWAAKPTRSSSWHPLRHAAMVAIESSAARDKDLFPNPTKTVLNDSTDSDNAKSSFLGSSAKKQKTDFDKVNGCEEAVNSQSRSARPYLCTGYDIFLVWEPCPMCAMALVHQRIRRIFFAFPNPNTGALGSVYRLQGERSLNHHYAVFRVVMPEPVFSAAETRD